MTMRLEVQIRARLGDFLLDVTWTGGDGVTALFGPSGAGKTLTLHCLAGLVRPETGRIRLDRTLLFDAAAGVDVPPQARRLGYVFQGCALFPHLTVQGNIAFGLRQEPPRIRAARTAQIIARLGLTGMEARYPRELSGGQQQRVALGRALATSPALVLLDEPFAALDLPLRQALREELRLTLVEWKVPAVLVTHDLAEAYALADQVIIYDAGRVRQAAPRGELLSRPASETVARILGFRNLLQGSVVDATPARIRLRWRGQLLEAPNFPTPFLPAPGAAVAFFIRPEDLRLIRKDGPSPDPKHHTHIFCGTVVGEVDAGVTRTLRLRLDAPGTPAQATYDLEMDIPRFVYEILHIEQDRSWRFSIHRGSIHVLQG